MHDEELAGCRVGIVSSRHGDNASLVLDGIVVTVSAEFTVELLLGAAHTVAEGVAALDHKAGDNSVEGEAVVEAFLCERFKVCDSLGCVLGIELKLDLAAVFHFDDYHIFFLSWFKNIFFVYNLVYLFPEYMMNYEKIKRYADLVVLVIGLLLLFYLFFKYILIYTLPFFIGWFLAFAVRRPSAYISSKLRLKPKLVRLVLTVLIFAALFGIAALSVWLLSREVWELLAGIGSGDSSFDEFLYGLTSPDGFFAGLFGNFTSYVADALYGVFTSMLNSLGSFISAAVSFIPRSLLFIVITVIASAYFAVGLEDVNRAVKSILPGRVSEVLVKVKDGFLSTLFKYLRSYLLLLLITFGEMLVGLFLLRAPYPLVMAIVIAFLDLLPVIGVGFVLIPWSVWSFVIGRTPFGIGLLVLFGFHTVLRQVIEPKIVGKNLGIHPLLTLIFIYVGYSVFGFIGIILVPIFTVLINITLGKKDAAEVTEDTG